MVDLGRETHQSGRDRGTRVECYLRRVRRNFAQPERNDLSNRPAGTKERNPLLDDVDLTPGDRRGRERLNTFGRGPWRGDTARRIVAP